MSLPIKLAVSLLKDRNGVIDLDVPVTGSLDDPQFRLAPIIWKAFLNIVEKSRDRAIRAAWAGCSAAVPICSSSTSSPGTPISMRPRPRRRRASARH